MFYRDFILTVERADRHHFMAQLFTLVHEKFSQLQCAVAFPGWAPAAPNATDSFDTFTRYADIGDVIRLFADNEAVLAAAERILGIEQLVSRRVVLVMPVKPVPTGCKGAAFCRVRKADSIGRRSRNVTPDVSARMKDELRAQSHQLAYIRMADSHGNNLRPLVFTKVVGDAVAGSLATNSYGLSASTAPCFLPDF